MEDLKVILQNHQLQQLSEEALEQTASQKEEEVNTGTQCHMCI